MSFSRGIGPVTPRSTAAVMRMLDAGVPLSLLCDLVSLATPGSVAINVAERPPTDAIWLDRAYAGSSP